MTCPTCGLSQEEHQGLMDDLQGSEREVRRLRRVETALKNKLNEQRADSPLAGEIREVLEYYVTRFQKTRSFKVGPGGARWALVEKALQGDHTVSDLKEAIDGLRAFPFVGGGGVKGRTASGTEDERYDEIKYCVQNDMDIDRFRKYAQKAKRAAEPKQPELWPPLDRILLALRDRGLDWRPEWRGPQPDEGRTWRHVGQCPTCIGRLRVGVCDNGWATLRCELDCDFFRVLEALGVDPSELARPFDPAMVAKPAPVLRLAA